MSHPEVEYSAIFTCHNCGSQNEQRTIEWPPKVFACGNQECGALFRFLHEREDGEISMKLIYRAYK